MRFISHAQGNLTMLPTYAATKPAKNNGYDLPITGLDNGQFYIIHIPALICIFLSLISVIAILVSIFKEQKLCNFFSLTKSERFVVYLAICDGLFNVFHSMDHLHILIMKDHVYPRDLCVFYGFMLAECMTSQHLMVNIISMNAFVLIYFRKNIVFGKCDWKLLLWVFGLPFAAATIAAGAGTMGPNGAFCYFDGVKGDVANIFFTTVPLLLIFTLNIILYFLTWYRIRKEEPTFKGVIGNNAQIIRASHRAARTMSLFVTAFFVQWWAMALYGVWQLANGNVPHLLFQFVTTFSNIGGVLNGIVYIIIRRRKRSNELDFSDQSHNSGKHCKNQNTDISFDWSSTERYNTTL